MRDPDCVHFLQWALPHMSFRWRGFRKVRGQVCKRIGRRLAELGLDGLADYRHYLRRHPDEWHVLEGFCHVTISRFYRNRGVFDWLGDNLLPDLASRVGQAEGERRSVQAWCAGCASGEEPYTVQLVWSFKVAPRYPHLRLRILATDAEEVVLERAVRGCYAPGTLKELPAAWRHDAFESAGDELCLKRPYRRGVGFLQQDLRREMPEGPFDLIFCRNLAFTYFDEPLQRLVAQQLVDRLQVGGLLVLGSHEAPPEPLDALADLGRGIFRRIGVGANG